MRIAVLTTHVDDIIIVGDNTEEIGTVIKKLFGKYKVRDLFNRDRVVHLVFSIILGGSLKVCTEPHTGNHGLRANYSSVSREYGSTFGGGPPPSSSQLASVPPDPRGPLTSSEAWSNSSDDKATLAQYECLS